MAENLLSVEIEKSWYKNLEEELKKPYFNQLSQLLKSEKSKGKIIYPEKSKIFSAFNSTPFDQVKAVILGQDPYHGPDQAMGLSFSVPENIRVPPSLRNIYKELHRSTGFDIPDHGNLSAWAEQGVFLLNAILTVEAGKPRSHAKMGWETFTNKVIQILSDQTSGLVFLLWGNFAKSKKHLIDSNRHLILESRHPSPLAGNSFVGNNHFLETNNYLSENGKIPVNWSL